MPKQSIKLYLRDINEAIGKIEGYIEGMTLNEFSGDAKTIDAVVRNVEIIGEAARQLPNDVRLKYPIVPWKQIVGARDKVIHEYFGIDIEIIWKTISEDLPVLKKQLGDIEKNI